MLTAAFLSAVLLVVGLVFEYVAKKPTPTPLQSPAAKFWQGVFVTGFWGLFVTGLISVVKYINQ